MKSIRWKTFFLFFSFFLLTACVISYSLYIEQRNNAQDVFYDRYTTLLKNISASLREMDKATDTMIAGTASALSKYIKLSGTPTDADLKKVAKSMGVDDFFVTDQAGDFTAATNRKNLPQSVLGFCPYYKEYLTGTRQPEQTPIMMSSQGPYKFAIRSLNGRDGIVETGMKASFLGNILGKVVGNDSQIIQLGLFTPTGDILHLHKGSKADQFSLNYKNVKTDSLYVYKNEDNISLALRVEPSSPTCCECSIKKQVDNEGKYFYILAIQISKEKLNKNLEIVLTRSTKTLTTMIFFGLLISIIFSFSLSKRIKKLNNFVNFIKKDGYKNQKIISSKAGDELDELSRNFQEMIVTLSEKQKVIGELEAKSVASRTTQMLAHDVRKPFSTIQMALTLIRDAKSVDQLNSFLPLIESEIDASLTNVNGLIQDVMEIGGKSNLHLEDASPATLVKESLEETSRMFSDAETSISFDFQHTSKVNVDKVRIKRVFSNIFANACQAMKREGSLYVKTQECDGMVGFTLGNVGSYIPEEDITELFNAFYTKNKSGGTGLGLAIAEKLVKAHGGEISARSSEEQQTVEFVFTLPRSNEIDSERKALPTSLEEYAPAVEQIALGQTPANDHGGEVERLKSKLSELLGGRRITIGILDDEKVYREGISKLAEVLEGVDFIEFPRPEELLIGVFQKNVQLDFVIADIDLQHEVDGFKVVDELRRHCKFDAPICFHSNRSDPEAIAKALEVGGTSFLPKPMTLEHLLRFVTDNLAIKPLS